MPRTTVAALVTVLALLVPAAWAAEPAPAPASKPGDVPATVLADIEALFKKPNETDPDALVAKYLAQMEQVLTVGAKAEKDYPNAANLYAVRLYMLNAADLLRVKDGGPESIHRILEVSRRLADSPGPPQARIIGEYNLLMFKLRPTETQPADNATAAKEIRAFVSRYADTDVKVDAIKRGLVLAAYLKLTEVEKEYADLLTAKHLAEPGVLPLLDEIGRNPAVGKPFTAELTRLDGKKLTLPQDLKGKVVVIDFWATWCPPCVKETPHMKEVYEKYSPKGVEFVGISIDDNRTVLQRFLKDEGITWTITFSGKRDDDPTLRKYGVEGIPTIWVLDKQGNVITTRARGQLESVLDEALK